MPTDQESNVFSIVQPELLPVEDLVQKIQSRFCKIQNLELMSKEELVGLFRRVILPLPQRFYRTNRRGKMLSSCRAKAGLETRRKDEGCSDEKSHKASASNGRLKPPPDKSDFHKIRVSINKSGKSSSESGNLDNIVIKDRRKLNDDDRREDEGRRNSKIPRSGSPPGKIITLKRSSTNEKSPTQSEDITERKKQRTAIRWP